MSERLSRREALRRGVALTAAGCFAESFGLMSPHVARAQSTLTPRAALDELLAGNKRFVSGTSAVRARELAALRQRTESKQEPFAAVLACADSRVPVELIFDQSIGQLFVARLAGNVVTPEVIGSLEYGAAELGTKAILVLGHSHCGAVKATIANAEAPGAISSLFAHIQPAVDQAGPDPERATKVNAKNQAALLRRSSVVISRMLAAKTILVAAGYYDLGAGTVSILE